jgi:adenylate cyclase
MTPLRRIWPPHVRSVRVCSGLILFAYVTEHLLNHALGNVSLDWMGRGLAVHLFIWDSVIGTTALYGAMVVHFILGLWALYERRRLHWTGSEFTQLVLGLAVPPLLANHLAGTRLAAAVFDIRKGYAQEFYSFYISAPFFGWMQLALLIVAWTHGCLGLYFWLRLKPWFATAKSWLFAAAVLVPVLALLGYFRAGHEVTDLARDPAWVAEAMRSAFVGTPAQVVWLNAVRDGFLMVDAVALALILVARGVRVLRERHRGLIRVTYPDGHCQAVPLGFSVLEASLMAGIPHASACGGRARCSLCRIRVTNGSALPPAQEAELRLLDYVGLDPTTVRLACQLRPIADLSVIPLVPPGAQMAFLHRGQQGIAPQERFLVHMFIDLRDSTAFAATRPPHDTVFVLGRFIAGASSAVLEAGGVPNQFLGDGLLALFGLRSEPRVACRQALAALGAVARNVRLLNTLLGTELGQTLRYGIGVHCGATIVGEIGFRDHVTFTGLGDPPNVASRLQAMTKELGCESLVSEDVFLTAGVEAASVPLYEARLRGRAEPVPARVFRNVEDEMAKIVTQPVREKQGAAP